MVVINFLNVINFLGSGIYEYIFGFNIVFLSVGGGNLSVQVIIVNFIINVIVKGYIYVCVQGYDLVGNVSNVVISFMVIFVVDCVS